jgi:enoyl-CoA hydratase
MTGPIRIFETLQCETIEDNILLIRLNRPDVRNAMNTQMGLDLHCLFVELQRDPADIRCVILTGAGEKAFCAGGDLKERASMSDKEWRSQHVIFEQSFHSVMDCPLPLIAAVNGAAFGGGCELALACDFILAAEIARFALTEVGLGIIPGGGGTQNLARAVGARRAKQIILTAEPFSAQQALEWGMVNSICPPSLLLRTVLDVARRIVKNAPIAVREAKNAIRLGIEVDIKTGLSIEIAAYNVTVPTEDRREGVAAFNDRRAPKFSGR